MAGPDFMDLNRLRELEDVLGSDDLDELIQAFLEDAAQAVTAIGEQQSGGPGEERSAQFHYLAGAAQNVGAAGLGALCLRFERSPEGFGPSEYQAMCAEFRRVWVYFGQRQGAHPIAAAG